MTALEYRKRNNGNLKISNTERKILKRQCELKPSVYKKGESYRHPNNTKIHIINIYSERKK